MGRCLLLIFISFLSIPVWAQQDWSRWKLEEQVDPLAITVLGRYVTSAQLKRLVRYPTKGQIVTVDTHNREVCEKTRRLLDEKTDLPDETLKTLCDQSRERFVSVVRIEPTTFEKDNFEFQFSDQPTIFDQIEVFNFLGVGMMGVIASVPPEISNWDENAFADPLGKWRSNVLHPPVVDQDDWAINYLGHPYSGAAYYVVARQTGFGAMTSFGFAAMMSTFYWEYGFEAFAEKPSIQDLVLTPTIGSLLGEPLYQLNESIRRNRGTLLGSKGFGTMGLIVSDPVGSLVNGVNKLGNNQWVNDGKMSWASFPFFDHKGSVIDRALGIRVDLRFGKKK